MRMSSRLCPNSSLSSVLSVSKVAQSAAQDRYESRTRPRPASKSECFALPSTGASTRKLRDSPGPRSIGCPSPSRTRRALQIDSLWFASIDQEVELRNHTSIAVPEPVAVWARGGHLAVRSRNREPAVVLEDGALRGQQVGQDVRAWSGEVCAAASKAGLEPTE